MKALRQYLDDRLLLEQNEMLFQINTLRTNYDANSIQMEETIARLVLKIYFSVLVGVYKYIKKDQLEIIYFI